MGKIEGKTALITGAGSGIGRAAALLLASEGATVAAADCVLQSGEETVRLVHETGGEALFIEADVSRSPDVQRMVESAVESYGRIDILYNNAGIMGPMALTADLSEEDWDAVLNTNLKSVFLCSRAAITVMLEQGGGVIISTASVHGMVRVPGCPAYGVSKAGIVLLTRQMAAEYAGQGIRVNCICPGLVASPMALPFIPFLQLDHIPMGRAALPDEIARAALFLASDDSTYVTGSCLAVDGGWTAEVILPQKEIPAEA